MRSPRAAAEEPALRWPRSGRSGGGAMAETSGEVASVPAAGAANGLNNGPGGISAQSNNPLSRKLHKILETRLDNDKVAVAAGAGSPVRPQPGGSPGSWSRGPGGQGASAEAWGLLGICSAWRTGWGKAPEEVCPGQPSRGP